MDERATGPKASGDRRIAQRSSKSLESLPVPVAIRSPSFSSPVVLIALQRAAGNRATGEHLAHAALASPPPTAQLLSESKSEREKIVDALKSKDPGDIKKIEDWNAATIDERLQLVRPLAYQSWAGPRDEWAIEAIWRSFGDRIPEIANRDILLWEQCLSVGAALDKLPVIQKIKIDFMRDVQNLALDYMRKNRVFIKEEDSALTSGGEHGGKADEKISKVQADAKDVADALKVQDILHGTVVGFYERESTKTDGLIEAPRTFDPDHPPDKNLDHKSSDPKRDWTPVKGAWDVAVDTIRRVSNHNVSVYAALQAGNVRDLSGAQGQDAARTAAKKSLQSVLNNISSAEGKVPGNDPDYRDLVPLHAQLLSGQIAGVSGRHWSEQFPQLVICQDLEDHKVQEYWTRLGLQTAAAAAFLVAEFATVGSATFLLAAGAGLAITGSMAAGSVAGYQSLLNASRTNVKDETAVVDKQAVGEAARKALEDALAFAISVASLGLRAALAARAAKAAATANVSTKAPVAKFSDYIFKEGADHGKDKVFRSYGYGGSDSASLATEYERQAAARFAAGDYQLGKLDQYGQRIDITIDLTGKGAAAGRSTRIVSGWMIRSDGSITLNTPFSGFVK